MRAWRRRSGSSPTRPVARSSRPSPPDRRAPATWSTTSGWPSRTSPIICGRCGRRDWSRGSRTAGSPTTGCCPTPSPPPPRNSAALAEQARANAEDPPGVLVTSPLWRRLAAEFLGTALLVTAVVGSGIMAHATVPIRCRPATAGELDRDGVRADDPDPGVRADLRRALQPGRLGRRLVARPPRHATACPAADLGAYTARPDRRRDLRVAPGQRHVRRAPGDVDEAPQRDTPVARRDRRDRRAAAADLRPGPHRPRLRSPRPRSAPTSAPRTGSPPRPRSRTPPSPSAARSPTPSPASPRSPCPASSSRRSSACSSGSPWSPCCTRTSGRRCRRARRRRRRTATGGRRRGPSMTTTHCRHRSRIPEIPVPTSGAHDMTSTSQPSVLFVCVHNAGRSQMAAGWLRHLAGDTIEVRSAGSEPGEQINPVAVAAMAEVGIDITARSRRILRLRTSPKAPTSSSPWAAATPAPSSPANATRTGTLDRPGRAADRGRPAPSATRSATGSSPWSPSSCPPKRADRPTRTSRAAAGP